ncbi:hypothetical protein M0804_001783 [Polistes exclamans]|nr:hypothetical protein M0804_001783 [Polistes exclamans]
MRLNVKTLSFLKGRVTTLELLRDKIERLGPGNIKGENQKYLEKSKIDFHLADIDRFRVSEGLYDCETRHVRVPDKDHIQRYCSSILLLDIKVSTAVWDIATNKKEVTQCN